MALRRVVVVISTVLLSAFLALPAAARPGPELTVGRPLGIVPVREAKGGAARPKSTSNLTYHNGPTMHTNTTFAIFWGASNAWESGYQSLIERYFGDVATASGAPSNVYWAATQYFDTATGSPRPIQYASTFGGTFLDTTAYPANGCTDKATNVCLSDAQLQAEIQADMQATGWSGTAPVGGQSQLIFIFTPQGVGSCAGGSCAYTNYCAYHSWIGSGTAAILYANQPYANQNYRIYTCNSGQWPNGSSADATLNLVSHEHNEAITDEQANAWFDASGNEDGDKCAWRFGAAAGSTGSGQFNQIINGHDYYLQQEWSNHSSGCVLTGW